MVAPQPAPPDGLAVATERVVVHLHLDATLDVPAGLGQTVRERLQGALDAVAEMLEEHAIEYQAMPVLTAEVEQQEGRGDG